MQCMRISHLQNELHFCHTNPIYKIYNGTCLSGNLLLLCQWSFYYCPFPFEKISKFVNDHFTIVRLLLNSVSLSVISLPLSVSFWTMFVCQWKFYYCLSPFEQCDNHCWSPLNLSKMLTLFPIKTISWGTFCLKKFSVAHSISCKHPQLIRKA